MISANTIFFLFLLNFSIIELDLYEQLLGAFLDFCACIYQEQLEQLINACCNVRESHAILLWILERSCRTRNDLSEHFVFSSLCQTWRCIDKTDFMCIVKRVPWDWNSRTWWVGNVFSGISFIHVCIHSGLI